MTLLLLVVACSGGGPTSDPSPPPPNTARKTFVKADSTIVLTMATDITRAEVRHGECEQSVRVNEDGHLMMLHSPQGQMRLHLVDGELDVGDESFCGETVDLSGTYTEVRSR